MSWLFDTSGSAHMDVEHNIIFSLAEPTFDSGMETVESGNFIGAIPGFTVASLGSGIGYSTVPFDLSTDASTAGRDLGGDASSSVASSDSSSENPDSIPVTIVGTSILGTVGSSVNFTTPDEYKYGIVIFKNDRPNSYVEKSAASVYNSLHGKPDSTYNFPALITESPEGYKTAMKLFGGGSLEKAKETLDIWESILDDHV